MKLLLISAVLLFGSLEIAWSQSTRAPRRGEYAYLEIMHEHQSPYLSLPACVAMAMNYYGDGKSQWTVKRLSNEHKDLFSGTTLEEIRDGIKPLGYTWDRWQWPGDSIGFNHAIDAIEQSLDDGKPVILEVLVQFFARPGRLSEPKRSHEAGHALLAFGYDKSAREVFILDPAMQFPGKRHIPFDELREMWRRGGHFHALFTAAPGKLPTGHKE